MEERRTQRLAAVVGPTGPDLGRRAAAKLASERCTPYAARAAPQRSMAHTRLIRDIPRKCSDV